ncbi:PGF-pre-PGF domain-containing protein [Methanococcoides sp. LMO-2]|uniref:PGF-pre-PGF domain-containing protein n=1 Tax=Methanococcoides cohabitans TaxID=3136559 RepID=A0ABU9KRL5_9EURY
MKVKSLLTNSFTNSFSGPPGNKIFSHLLVVFLFLLSVFTFIDPVSAETLVILSPDNQSAEVGSEFVVNVYVESDVPISGMQFDLYFDGSMLNVKSVLEGDLFSKTATTFFNKGTIDNTAGSIIYSHGVILGKEEVTNPGVLATIVFEPLKAGTSDLNFANVIISNSSGSSVPISVNDAVVIISDTSFTGVNTGSSGSGSSGGGGGGATGEAFDNILVKDASTSNVVAGELSRYEFSEEKSPIGYIQFKGVSNAGQISTLIEVLEGTSKLVGSQAPGVVYQNMNIWVGNAAFGDDKIEDAVIGFRVSKEWLFENDIEASSVVLYRYSDEKWNRLSTIDIEEDDQYSYFEAETPGFSPFAITAITEKPGSAETGDSVDEVSSEDAGINDNDDQTLSQNMVLVIFIVFMFLAVKRGRGR